MARSSPDDLWRDFPKTATEFEARFATEEDSRFALLLTENLFSVGPNPSTDQYRVVYVIVRPTSNAPQGYDLLSGRFLWASTRSSTIAPQSG